MHARSLTRRQPAPAAMPLAEYFGQLFSNMVTGGFAFPTGPAGKLAPGGLLGPIDPNQLLHEPQTK